MLLLPCAIKSSWSFPGFFFHHSSILQGFGWAWAATALRYRGVRRAEHSQTNAGPSGGTHPKNATCHRGPGQV